MSGKNNPSHKFNEQEFCDLTKNVIDQAKKMGATAAETHFNTSHGFSVNVRKNKVETVEHNNDKNLNITVYFGYRTGTTSTSDLKPEAIRTAIEKACHIARFTSEDPYVGLADSKLMAYNYPNLDLYHPWPIKIEEAIELLKNCEAQGFSYDKRITNSDGVTLDTISALGIYANSHGFCGIETSTKHSIACSFIAEQNGDMQRDFYYTIARNNLDLENANNVAIKTAKRTVNRLDAKNIKTCKAPVIFAADIASSLINNLISAIYGNNIYRKTSFLCDHLHKPVLAKQIDIEENPFLPRALGSTAFDDEGVRLSRNDLVIGGILQRYLLDSYSARKLNMKTTGNAGGIHNLIVKTDSLDFNSLLHKMNTGLLVTELMGSGINIVTGDYSRGVFGYWVENGSIQYPVTGITIAGNLKDMLLNIVAVSNDIDYRSNILTGSILIDQMIIAGS